MSLNRLSKMDQKQMAASLSTLIGARLSGICRGDLLLGGESCPDDMGPLELIFEDGRTIQAKLADDGESVVVGLFPERPSELGGQGGPWPRLQLSHQQPYASLLHQTLVDLRYLHFGAESADPDVLAGVEFLFGSESRLTYCNAGDFAKIYVNVDVPALPHPFHLRFSKVPPGG